MSAKAKDIHIARVDVEMLHRLTFAKVELEPGGQLVRVTGNNGAGKSSFLRAIREVLGGAGEVVPEAVNDEAENGKGFASLTLTNGFKISRTFTEAAPKGRLKVVGPGGGDLKQADINEWLGARHDFDILSFYGLRGERQTEIILGLSSDPDLTKKLDKSRATRETLKRERTPHISEQQRCWRVKEPQGERPEPVDVSGEMEKLGQLQAAERERADIETKVRSSEMGLRGNDELQLAQSNRISTIAKQLKDAEAGLANLEAVRIGLEEDRVVAEDALAQTSPAAADIQAIQERVSQADAVNASLEPWREFDRAQSSLKEATATVDSITTQIDELGVKERKLVAGAGIPVEGLTLSPDAEPLLNGKPLEVASGGERIRMAMDVAVAADPDLKVILIDEANDLDMEMMGLVAKEAEARGFQVFVCRIGLEGRGDVSVEDGVALSASE